MPKRLKLTQQDIESLLIAILEFRIQSKHLKDSETLKIKKSLKKIERWLKGTL